MPYYDYNCTNCRYIFEIQKGMNESLEPKCPKCGAKARRIFTVPRALGSEQSGSCSSCSSGVCSSCGGG